MKSKQNSKSAQLQKLIDQPKMNGFSINWYQKKAKKLYFKISFSSDISDVIKWGNATMKSSSFQFVPEEVLLFGFLKDTFFGSIFIEIEVVCRG